MKLNQNEKTDWDKYNKLMKNNILYRWFLNNAWKGYYQLLKGIIFNDKIKILEFGGGSGILSLNISKMYDTEKIVIIDNNKRNLEICEKNLSRANINFELILGDFFEYNSKDRFDIVHSQGVVEHFNYKDRINILKRHFNFSKQNGYIIIFTPTPTLAYNFWRNIFEFTHTWIFKDEIPINLKEIESLINMLDKKIINTSYFWKYFLTEVGVLCKN